MPIPHVLRPYDPEHDARFVYNSFQRSQRSAIPALLSPDNIFMQYATAKIRKIMDQSSIALVAANGDSILGYVFADKQDGFIITNFIYVKHLFRKNKIASELMDAAYASAGAPPLMLYTCHSRSWLTFVMNWRKDRQVDLVYNPEALHD